MPAAFPFRGADFGHVNAIIGTIVIFLIQNALLNCRGFGGGFAAELLVPLLRYPPCLKRSERGGWDPVLWAPFLHGWCPLSTADCEARRREIHQLGEWATMQQVKFDICDILLFLPPSGSFSQIFLLCLTATFPQGNLNSYWS